MKHLFYFGCIRDTGHHLWAGEAFTVFGQNINYVVKDLPPVNRQLLNCIDGNFTPGSTAEQGKYQESLVPPFRIVAWHDYSVDKRPGSNSALLGIGYDSAEEMLDSATSKFPSVMTRQPRPTKL